MYRGFITLHRKITQWEWYTDGPTKDIFLHLLLTANHEDRNWRGITIKRGQKLTSISKLANETGLTVQQTRTALLKLEQTNEITRKPTNKYTIITVEKYSDYQDKKEQEQQTNDTQNDTQNNTQDNKQATTNNNEEQIKQIKQYSAEEISTVEKVVAYLNEKAGTNYKATTDNTRKHIRARLQEGYTLQDFIKVIDTKCEEWLGTQHEKYLRPQTLFIPANFESYVNQKSEESSALEMAKRNFEERSRRYDLGSN